jgi:hypothetical protein
MIDIVFTLLFNALPLLIFIVPLIFLRKKIVGKLYSRIVIGVVVFYLIYWILPIIFQIGVDPKELSVQAGDESNMSLGFTYIITHFLSLLTLVIVYPFVSLPFIFCAAPFISLIFVRRRLKKEGGLTQEVLSNVTYEYNQSPYEMIKTQLKESDWTREKEILKLLIVLLPISLYLLQVILKISGLETLSLTEGKTALGWFLEILFVYLAIFIFSIELLSSSKLAYNGRYFGENIRENAYRSLYTVGAPISILTLILFIVESASFNQLFVIIYFFSYFIMASVLFVLFIDIFEPISILILVKLVNWWKERKEKKAKIETENIYYGLIFGIIGFAAFWFLYAILPFLFITPTIGSPAPILETGRFTYLNPTLMESLQFDVILMFGIAMIIMGVIVLSMFFSYGLKNLKGNSVGFLVFIPIIIVATLVIGLQEEYWLTGQTSYTNAFGFKFYTLRTASFDASLRVEGVISLLGVLGTPYSLTRYIFCISFMTLFFFYIRKPFKIKSIPIDEKLVKKTVFSQIDQFLTTSDYKEGKNRYLIAKNVEVIGKGVEQEREEVKDLLNILETDQMLEMIKPKAEQEDEFKRFYYTLKYLFTNNQITLWKPEFGYSYERVEKHALYIIMSADGRDVFNYPWVKGELQDPALISGMFSAITSFIQETTHATQTLNTIDHGDITIMIEYGQHILGALFIKGKQSTEIRAQLKEFIFRFEKKHFEILSDWTGTLAPFRDDNLIVEAVFKED